MLKTGCGLDIFLTTKLVIMYSKYGLLMDSHQLFGKLPERNVVSFNSMIAGYTRHGHGESALDLFYQMQRAGVKMDRYTVSAIPKARACLMSLEPGNRVHGYMITDNLGLETVLETALVDMYAKCGSVEDSIIAFNRMSQRDVVSWNDIISGYFVECKKK